jgi:hypothetical protein
MSIQKVIKGTKEARRKSAVMEYFNLRAKCNRTTHKQYAINKIPCAIPTYKLGSGM